MEGTEVKYCECGGNMSVVETRMRNGRLMRRRVCDGCADQFWTVEVRASRQYHELDFVEKERDRLFKRLTGMRSELDKLLSKETKTPA